MGLLESGRRGDRPAITMVEEQSVAAFRRFHVNRDGSFPC